MTLPFSAQLSQLPESLSLALLHFLWQGALLAAVLGLALQWIPRRAAAVRHNLACLALLLMLLAPPSTLVWILASDPATQPTVAASPNAIAKNNPSGSLAVPATLTFPTWGDSNWLPWVSVLWLGGVFGFSLRWIGGFREVHALKTRDTHAVTPEWLDRFERLRIRMGVGAKVRLLESTRITGPLVIGWLRPVVLMPLGLLSGLPTAQVESLILHELAHIRGNDYLINLIVRFAETVLFYHPAVWWVGKQIEQEREKRCDDFVCEVMGEGQSLAEALLNLCEREAGVSSMALAATGSSIGDRVRRLAGQEDVGTKPPVRRRWGWAMVLIVLLVGAALIVPNVRRQFLYKATAKVRFEQSDGQELTAMIHSNWLLKSVVDGIGLDEAWQLSPDQCVQKLAPRIRIKRYRMTSLFEIICADESPQMAAKLANRCAESLSDILRFQRPRLAHQTVEARSKRVRQLEGLVEEERERIAQSAKAGRTPSTKRYEMLDEMLLQEQRREVEEMLRLADMPGTPMEVIQGAEAETRRVFW